MAHWTCSTTRDGLVWRRPLGYGEASLFWDSVQEGATDALQYEQVDVGNIHLDVMDPRNIETAWLAVKRRFPLVAVQTIRDEDDQIYFQVHEERIKVIAEGELSIGQLNSRDEASAFNQAFLTGPRLLTFDQNVKVVIKSDPTGTHQRNNGWTRYHVWLLAAHTISDGAANMSLFTTFMSMITTPSERITKETIGERLSKVLDSGSVHHPPSRSLAQRRWRKAIAFALLHVREAHIKVSTSPSRRGSMVTTAWKGGHTLPNNIRIETPLTPAASRSYGVTLDTTRTNAVMRKCRTLGITLGNTVAPLCQIAHARILHRLRDEMPPGEWEQRIREPMHTAGPMNLRYKMPEEWRKNGGLTEFFFHVGIFQCTLPRMPACESSNPTFDELMTRKAFFNRCLATQKQTDNLFAHPMLHEMNEIRFMGRLQVRKTQIQMWEKQERGELGQQDLEVLEKDMSSVPLVFSNLGSSLGSVRLNARCTCPNLTRSVQAEETIAKRFPASQHGKYHCHVAKACS